MVRNDTSDGCLRFEMEQEESFAPPALLQELYSLESVVHSIISGAWQR